MRPLWLDYQRLPPGRRLPGVLLLIGSLLLAAFLLRLSIQTSAETTATEQLLYKLNTAAERRRLFASPDKGSQEVTAATSDKALSPSASRWTALFSALEAAANDTVTLLSLQPGAHEVVITGEANGLEAALDYTQRLQAGGLLNNVHLAKYEIVRENPHLPVRFTVLAEWREGAG